MPKARYALRAIWKPILPSPMMPRLCPRGLCESAAACVWQSLKSAAEERADCVHLDGLRSIGEKRKKDTYQVRFRKVARMRKMAKSATASEEATALRGVRCHVFDGRATSQQTCCNIQFLVLRRIRFYSRSIL